MSTHAPHPLDESVEVGRRGLLRALLAASVVALGAVGGFWAVAIARLLAPETTRPTAGRLKVGPAGDFPRGCVDARYRQSHGIWLVHAAYQGQWQISALRAACTHLGCMTRWDASQGKFRCPCHGSGFRPDGTQCEGPAPRPLERCAIRHDDDGQLEIDLARTYRQEQGQWSDPDSYVVA